MHKFLVFTFFLLTFQFLSAFGQEQLFPLKSNVQIERLVDNQPGKSNSTYPAKVYYEVDTLNLPLIDDFSSNKFQDFYYYSYPSSLITQEKVFSFELTNVNPPSIGMHPTSVKYSKNPQQDIIYNLLTSQYDTIPTQQFTISFYSFPKVYPLSPFTPDSSFVAWRAARRYDNGSADTTDILDFSVVSLSLHVDTIEHVRTVGSLFEKRIWMDEKKTVFVNNTFCKNQPTIGVATFDGLNEKGMPYDTASIISHGRADKLTSKPIRIFNSTPKYLSFLWQRAGMGDEPEFTDSLILQFRTPTKSWTTMWYQAGGDVDSTFTQKTILIDSVFLTTGFQFRFINRATLNGANDHWNIDYVRLVSTPADTIIDDLAFVSHPTSLLQDYQSVPYTQYSSSLMATSVQNKINNLSSFLTGQNSNFNFRVTDYFGNNQLDAFNVDNFNFASGINQCSFCDLVLNPLKVTPSHPSLQYPILPQCSEFRIKQWITPLNLSTMRENDTTQFIQTLSDYYAYDDGSAEAGYLLSNIGSNMAVQFEVFQNDDMRGIKIFFSPVNENFSTTPFYLRLWKDSVTSSGFHQPGILLKEYGPLYPDYDNNDGYSSYAEYLFDSNVSLASGIYYAGFYKEDAGGLNVGFDRNRNLQTKMFFTPQTSTWANTQFEGSYMIRPLFATCPNGIPSSVQHRDSQMNIEVIPNPADTYVYLQATDLSNYLLEIFDFSGQLVQKVTLTENQYLISLSEYSSGVYYLRFSEIRTGKQLMKKLMIVK